MVLLLVPYVDIYMIVGQLVCFKCDRCCFCCGCWVESGILAHLAILVDGYHNIRFVFASLFTCVHLHVWLFFSASSLIAVVFLVILPYWRRYRQTTDSVDSYMKWSRPPHSHLHHRLWCKYHTGRTHHHHIPHTYQYMRQHQITRYALVFSLTMTTMS